MTPASRGADGTQLPALWPGGDLLDVIAADGERLVAQCLLPAERSRGIVQIMHGMNEHPGRYARTAAALSTAGWAVVAHAMRGHGRTAGSLERVMHLGDRGGWDAAVGDVLATARLERELVPGGPLVWLGHSLGSLLVRDAAARFPSVPDALVVLGTAGPPSALHIAGRVLGEAQSALFGPRHRAVLIDAVNSGRYRNGTPHAGLTRDVALRREYTEDPWAANVPTARFFADVTYGVARVARPEVIAGVRPDLPVLVAAGTVDRLGRDGAGPSWFAAQLRAAGVRDVELRLYEGARHEILQEVNRREVLADVLGWLDAHAPAAGAGRGPDVVTPRGTPASAAAPGGPGRAPADGPQ